MKSVISKRVGITSDNKFKSFIYGHVEKQPSKKRSQSKTDLNIDPSSNRLASFLNRLFSYEKDGGMLIYLPYLTSCVKQTKLQKDLSYSKVQNDLNKVLAVNPALDNV